MRESTGKLFAYVVCVWIATCYHTDKVVCVIAIQDMGERMFV